MIMSLTCEAVKYFQLDQYDEVKAAQERCERETGSPHLIIRRPARYGSSFADMTRLYPPGYVLQKLDDCAESSGYFYEESCRVCADALIRVTSRSFQCIKANGIFERWKVASKLLK